MLGRRESVRGIAARSCSSGHCAAGAGAAGRGRGVHLGRRGSEVRSVATARACQQWPSAGSRTRGQASRARRNTVWLPHGKPEYRMAPSRKAGGSLTESLSVGWSQTCGNSRRTAGHQARREYGQTDGMVRSPGQWTLPGKREFIRRMVAVPDESLGSRLSRVMLGTARPRLGGKARRKDQWLSCQCSGLCLADARTMKLSPNARSRVMLGSARPRLGEKGRAVIESRPAVWCPRPQHSARRRDDDSTHL